MPDEQVQVLVAGSGFMGRGIAASFADAGVPTAILSRDPARVTDVDARVRVFAELPASAPALIIESVPEIIELKVAFNARVEAAYGDAAVLGSNTSSLPLQAMAERLEHPHRYCGIHYFQPADIAPVVELARVRQSSTDTITTAERFLEQSGKFVVMLAEPVDGLLINRLQHAILHEAYGLIERGICTAADVDEAARRLLGPRMSVTGLIEQKDLSGLDTHALAQKQLVPALDHGAQAHDVVQRKYAAGQLGVKTGLGFYDWRNVDVPGYRAQTAGLLRRLLEVLENDRPTPPPLAPDDG